TTTGLEPQCSIGDGGIGDVSEVAPFFLLRAWLGGRITMQVRPRIICQVVRILARRRGSKARRVWRETPASAGGAAEVRGRAPLSSRSFRASHRASESVTMSVISDERAIPTWESETIRVFSIGARRDRRPGGTI